MLGSATLNCCFLHRHSLAMQILLYVGLNWLSLSMHHKDYDEYLFVDRIRNRIYSEVKYIRIFALHWYQLENIRNGTLFFDINWPHRCTLKNTLKICWELDTLDMFGKCQG